MDGCCHTRAKVGHFGTLAAPAPTPNLALRSPIPSPPVQFESMPTFFSARFSLLSPFSLNRLACSATQCSRLLKSARFKPIHNAKHGGVSALIGGYFPNCASSSSLAVRCGAAETELSIEQWMFLLHLHSSLSTFHFGGL
jgi:hypothetical protein